MKTFKHQISTFPNNLLSQDSYAIFTTLNLLFWNISLIHADGHFLRITTQVPRATWI